MEEKTMLIQELIDSLLKKYDLCLLEPFRLYPVSSEYTAPHPEDMTALWRFTGQELQCCISEEKDEWVKNDEVLCDMAREAFHVIQEVYRPKVGQRYYYVAWNTLKRDPYITEDYWDGATFDVYNLIHGNCFLTPQIAKKQVYKIYDEAVKGAGL